MCEIVVAKPILNPERSLRDFSYQNRDEIMPLFLQLLKNEKISPSTHPKAVDLCAGDGSYARMLVDNGWLGKNMTCVDMFRTDTPLVKDAVWKYWNLKEMANQLRLGYPIPEEVAQLYHSFDIGILMLGSLQREDRRVVCEYLVRPGGYIRAML